MTGVVWAVIRREYLQRVRSRWFVIATVAGPLLMLGLLLASAFAADQEDESERELAVVDRTGVLVDPVGAALEESGYEVEGVADRPGVEDELRRRVEAGALGGYLVVDEGTLEGGTARLVAGRSPSIFRQAALRRSLVQAALAVRFGEDDPGLRRLLAGGALEVDVLSDGGASMDEAAFGAAYAGAFLLYMTILLYAVAVMRSVLEEKTNRVVEVIISSIRPFQLMLGKILGVGAVGLTQLGIWVAAAVLFATAGIPALLAADPRFAQLSELRGLLPGPEFLGYFAVFFLGGYFMYSGLYAAVGAMCSTDEEAQQAQFPVLLLLIVPVIFLGGVIGDPNSTLSVTLSLVPFFSPILMFARAAGGAAPPWQFGLSVVGMALTVVAVAWVAGRIYKVGILMAGKRPTVPELVRWVREA